MLNHLEFFEHSCEAGSNLFKNLGCSLIRKGFFVPRIEAYLGNFNFRKDLI